MMNKLTPGKLVIAAVIAMAAYFAITLNLPEQESNPAAVTAPEDPGQQK